MPNLLDENQDVLPNFQDIGHFFQLSLIFINFKNHVSQHRLSAHISNEFGPAKETLTTDKITQMAKKETLKKLKGYPSLGPIKTEAS